jgi:stringent starvation protein B
MSNNDLTRYVIIKAQDQGRTQMTIVMDGDTTLDEAFEAVRNRVLHKDSVSSIVVNVDASQEPGFWERIGADKVEA